MNFLFDAYFYLILTFSFLVLWLLFFVWLFLFVISRRWIAICNQHVCWKTHLMGRGREKEEESRQKDERRRIYARNTITRKGYMYKYRDNMIMDALLKAMERIRNGRENKPRSPRRLLILKRCTQPSVFPFLKSKRERRTIWVSIFQSTFPI